MSRRYGKRRRVLERTVHAYETAPASGNSTEDLIRRTEYLLALQMLARQRGTIDAKKDE